MSAHIYWQLWVHEANSGVGSSSFCISEWVPYDASGSAISTSGVVATAGPAFTGAAANVFDGSTTTGYCANGTAFPQFLTAQFPSAVAIDHFSITNWPPGSGQGPSYFELRYSDNGSSWTTAFTYQSGMWDQGNTVSQTFYTTGIQYRLFITGTGGGGNTCVLGDMAFFDTSGTQLSTATGTVLARHQFATTSPGPAKYAFDGSCATAWESDLVDGAPSSSNAQWIGFHFPTNVSVSSFSLTSFNDPSLIAYAPTAFILQKSTDGATWTNVINATASWSFACQTQSFGQVTAAEPYVWLVF